jgi:hypothetical protein
VTAETAAPEGPATIGMVLLAPLTYSELSCLRNRLETARSDYSVLRPAAEYGSDWYADLDALWYEMRDLIAETHRASPAIIEADYRRSVAELGGTR